MKSTAWPRSMSAWPTAHIAWLLPTPGRPNAKHIGGVVEEVAVGELVEATHQRRRQASFIERGERFARRQLRGPAQPRDAALVSLLRLRAPGPRAAAGSAGCCSAWTNRETISRAAVVSVNPVSRVVI